MIRVEEVITRKQQREFMQFPLELYKDNPNFVPPLYADEKKIFRQDYAYYETCEAVYYNAYRDGGMVGRISGILQKASNEIRREKRVRFTRFDSIDDTEVAQALFRAVEQWALQNGMDTVCGPLGFSDLEREGLLIEGFDELATFEEQYNYAYYQKLIEHCGYVKEVDWVESKIYPPEKKDQSLDKMAELILKKNKLHMGSAPNIHRLLDKYADGVFDLLDDCYSELYGTVPITEKVREMVLENFKLILSPDYIKIILDENDKVVCFGVCMPSIARAVQKSGGRLTPGAIVRILKAVRHPQILDLGLIAVSPRYANCGVAMAAMVGLFHFLQEEKVEYAETNLNLEDNKKIQNQWKRFRTVQHKRRRSFVKKLTESV